MFSWKVSYSCGVLEYKGELVVSVWYICFILLGVLDVFVGMFDEIVVIFGNVIWLVFKGYLIDCCIVFEFEGEIYVFFIVNVFDWFVDFV